MKMTMSPVTGVNGYLNIDSLVASGMQLDTIRALVKTEGDTIRYQEYLGIINQNIGKMADEVVEVVYGIPIWYKGGKIIENAVE